MIFFWPFWPPPKKNTWYFWKKWVFTGRLFTSQKSTGYHYHLLYFMKKIPYNVNQSVWIADGERKGDCERREGAAKRHEKDAHLKTPLICRVSPLLQKKKPKKTTWFLSDLLPPPIVVWRGLTRTPPPPGRITWFVYRPFLNAKKKKEMCYRDASRIKRGEVTKTIQLISTQNF